ncbi:suppressor of cytokine signaling 3a [Poecilia formosa]|uniref:Suppressor of cytokine signaling 3a n=1 Tax=Poecilia formosa TaxID=48698 RepID=A0A087YS30_POEFO|nr:PREDICTED: suppressor of cytokine signaling 3 [Poecilia formosa]
MVTFSKNPAVNDDCFMVAKMQKQYHYKTFVSEDQFLMVLETLRGLRESDFYWSAITGKEAGIVLARQAPGTFLIRESSDRQHLFTLSVKTNTGTKNLRIVCEEDSFHLQTDPGNVERAPRFNCVLKLVDFYIRVGTSGFVYYINAGGERMPLMLVKPLYLSISPLKHLCRKKINKDLDISGIKETLPGKVQDYLDKYQIAL